MKILDDPSSFAKSGLIPETIQYVLRVRSYGDQYNALDPKPRRISGWEWTQDTWLRQLAEQHKFLGHDAFSTRGDKPATDSQLSWARMGRGVAHNAPVRTLEAPNAIIERVVIVGLEERGEGGRAYKGILTVPGTQEQVLVDVREDLILDAILGGGILAGGVLTGKFQWGLNGTQMRLMRVGSKRHTHIKGLTKRKGKATIKMTDLQLGHVYANKGNEHWVYIGTCRVDGVLHRRFVKLYDNDKSFQEAYRTGELVYVVKSKTLVEDIGVVPDLKDYKPATMTGYRKHADGRIYLEAFGGLLNGEPMDLQP